MPDQYPQPASYTLKMAILIGFGVFIAGIVIYAVLALSGLVPR